MEIGPGKLCFFAKFRHSVCVCEGNQTLAVKLKGKFLLYFDFPMFSWYLHRAYNFFRVSSTIKLVVSAAGGEAEH
jgi:hypothetical protein